MCEQLIELPGRQNNKKKKSLLAVIKLMMAPADSTFLIWVDFPNPCLSFFFCCLTSFQLNMFRLSISRSCPCSTVDPKTPLSPSLLPTGSPSSPWTPPSGRDGCTCIASLSSLNMTCEHYVVFYYLKVIYRA